MKTLKFKSNIKCMGCVAQVSPILNEERDIKSWHVDIDAPEKTLTVETEKLNADEVIELVRKSGFKAETI
jgi:copper chaperone